MARNEGREGVIYIQQHEVIESYCQVMVSYSQIRQSIDSRMNQSIQLFISGILLWMVKSQAGSMYDDVWRVNPFKKTTTTTTTLPTTHSLPPTYLPWNSSMPQIYW